MVGSPLWTTTIFIIILNFQFNFSSTYRGKPRYVRFGLITKLSYSVTDNIHRVMQNILHPNYTTEGTSQYHDIALLKIAPPVEFSETLKPACLNRAHNVKSPTAIASGFGKLNYFGRL